MSSLMVSHDLHIMMLEFSVEKINVPNTTPFDMAMLKKTIVKFRMLDNDWIELAPHREDYMLYNGSNLEEEKFHGGKSVVFAVPEAMLEQNVSNVDVKVHVHKEISKYFEMESPYDVGSTLINIDLLFNGIIKELKERKNMQGFFVYYHGREPISRSTKDTYRIINDSDPNKFASLTVYIRLSYFGKSIITEIERFSDIEFNVREETCGFPYQCLEVEREALESGCWGDGGFRPPINQQDLICLCNRDDRDDTKSFRNILDTGRGQIKIDQYDKSDKRTVSGEGDKLDKLKSKGVRGEKQADNAAQFFDNKDNSKDEKANDEIGPGKTKKSGKGKSGRRKNSKQQKGMKEGEDNSDDTIPESMKKIKNRKLMDIPEDDSSERERVDEKPEFDHRKKKKRRKRGSKDSTAYSDRLSELGNGSFEEQNRYANRSHQSGDGILEKQNRSAKRSRQSSSRSSERPNRSAKRSRHSSSRNSEELNRSAKRSHQSGNGISEKQNRSAKRSRHSSSGNSEELNRSAKRSHQSGNGISEKQNRSANKSRQSGNGILKKQNSSSNRSRQSGSGSFDELNRSTTSFKRSYKAGLQKSQPQKNSTSKSNQPETWFSGSIHASKGQYALAATVKRHNRSGYQVSGMKNNSAENPNNQYQRKRKIKSIITVGLPEKRHKPCKDHPIATLICPDYKYQSICYSCVHNNIISNCIPVYCNIKCQKLKYNFF